jgi:uncharacterized damage-inducible protein DinB
MTRYNAWQNDGVYGRCGGLGEEEQKHDRGMYFGSLHRTLDHILVVACWILAFVMNGRFDRFDPGPRIFNVWNALKAERRRIDEQIEELAQQCDQSWIDETLEIHSERFGRLRRIPRGVYLTQMFHHQTHHHSQVTAELWRLGIDYGPTDLPARPDSPY